MALRVYSQTRERIAAQIEAMERAYRARSWALLLEYAIRIIELDCVFLCDDRRRQHRLLRSLGSSQDGH